LRDATLIDLASGTGYLADILDPIVKRTIRVDKSLEMLDSSMHRKEIIYSDIKDVYTDLRGVVKADIITCLGALHHVYEKTGDVVDPLSSEKLQLRTINSWIKLLSPGGRLMLVDVMFPDLSICEPNTKPLSLAMKQYYYLKQQEFGNIILPIDIEVLQRIDKAHARSSFGRLIRDLVSTTSPSVSLANIIGYQEFRNFGEVDRLVPIDFFDLVVDKYSIDRHFACFMQEAKLAVALKAMGLKNVLVGCLPTPWIFNSEVEAIWFVRELFSLGKEHIHEPEDIVKHPDYDHVKKFIEEFLGIYTSGDITYVNWQLVFAYGEKP
jgi:SAM-dependent methyltransferase